MKKFLTRKVFGRQHSNKSYTRKMKRQVRKLLSRRAAKYGRNPGRADDIPREGEGHFGRLEEAAQAGSCRIYFQNARTVKLWGEETSGAFEVLKEAGVDIIGVTEVNKNWRHPEVKRRYETIIREHYPGAKIQVRSNKDYEPESRTKPGGVMTVTSRDVLEYATEAEGDHLGRWAKVEVSIGEWRLAIYTIYVPTRGELGGPSTVRRQLQHSVDKELEAVQEEEKDDAGEQGTPRTSEDWFQRLYEDLTDEVERDRENNKGILIGGDFNELHHENSEMTKRMEALNLVNIIGSRTDKIPPTRVPGGRAIDHMWACQEANARVKKMGLVPCDEVFISDHLGLFVDINTNKIIERLPEHSRNQRGLKSGNARNSKRYLKEVEQNVRGRKIKEAITELEKAPVGNKSSEEVRKKLNNVDKTLQDILMKCESILKKGDGTLFSARLSNKRAELRYWKKLRKALRGTHKEFKRVWPGHTPKNWRMSDRDVREKIRDTEKELEEYKERQEEMRTEFLEELAQDRGAKGEEEVAKAIREINRREKEAREWRRIKHATKGKRGRTLPEVQVPRGERNTEDMWEKIKEREEEPDEWETITGRERVEAIIIPWCARHFHQSEETPFTKGEWVRKLNILGEENEVEGIVGGSTVLGDEEPIACAQWIEELKRKGGDTEEVRLEAKYEEFEKFAVKVKENKGGGPSGRHYGHYLVISRNGEILDLVFRIMNLALRHGIVLDRWKTVHQLLLKKDEDGAKIHRFRNITLVEIDLMFVMKKVWARDLGNKVHKEETLNRAQYARKQQVPQNSVLNKRVSYDLQLVMREESFQSDNDARNCYDRIVDDIAVLSCMRMGLSKEAGVFLKKVLTHFRHHIVLGGEPSTEFFENEITRRLHGTGQGTGWSPMISSAVCDVIITLVEKHYPGQLFISPDGEIRASQHADAFVDDCNLSVNKTGVKEFNDKQGTSWDMVRASWEALNGYEQYLFSSGGKLAIKKCQYYWLKPKRERLKYVFDDAQEKDMEFGMGEEGRTIKLKYVKPGKEHKILGMWISPSGNRKEQVKTLMGKVQKWAEQMNNSGLPAYLKEKSFHSQLWPRISYVIGMALVSEEESKKIMAPALRVLRGALFLGRTFSGAILKLPEKYGGYDIKDLYTASVAEQAKMAISGMRGEDNTAKKIRILIEYHQMELGLRMSIFDIKAKEYLGLLTDTWLVRVIQRLHLKGMQVKTNYATSWAGTNPTIMEWVLQSDLSWEEKQKMNLCRMSEQVTYRDDLYERSGNLATGGEERGSSSALRWPDITVPKTWTEWWKGKIEEVFPRESTAKMEWIDRIPRSSGKRDTNSRRKRQEDQDPEVPRKKGVRSRKQVLTEHQRLRVKTWAQRNELVCASDASVEGNRKAVAVWFGSRKEDEGIMVAENVLGLPHDSGRAEMMGPVIVLEALEEINKESEIKGTIEMWSDSAESVRFSEKKGTVNLPSTCCARNTDLKLRWEAAQKNLKAKVEVRKVRAHQDREKKYEELAFEAQRNIDCDKKAGRKVKEVESSDYVDEVDEAVGVQLWCEEGGITGAPYEKMMEDEAEEIVKKRLKMSRRAFEEVDWEVHGGALKKIAPRERQMVKRMLWGELPTGRKLARNGFKGSDECALCGEVDTQKHFLECQALKEENVRATRVGVMRGKLAELNINPYLNYWVDESLKGRTPKLENERNLSVRRVVSRAFDGQNRVGWDNLTLGRVSKSMVSLQEWWEKESEGQGGKRKMESKEKIKKAMTIVMVTRYELWRLRSAAVIEKEGTTRMCNLKRQVRGIRERPMTVERRDEGLFQETRIPKEGDREQRYVDWIIAVQHSMKRRQRKERCESEQLAKTMRRMTMR